MNDTIYALSTPPGNGVAVIRISGTQASFALQRCFSHKGEYKSHMLYYGNVMQEDEIIDEGMAVLMRAPKSYTAEDCAEIHCHGSGAVIRRILAALSAIGLRAAERGEFTRRAFLNGRLELSQAEAVMDLIHACASADAKEALNQLKGSLAQTVDALQDILTDAIARIEAGIDYPEEDWEGEIAADVRPLLQHVSAQLHNLIASSKQGRLLREGTRVAIVGRPNVGKSSLLNALLGARRAIVTDIPGTTRDVIEEAMDWDGIPVVLMDTAGIREGTDEVERIGVELTHEAMQRADLVLLVFDGAQPLCELDELAISAARGLPCMSIISKGDLPQVLCADELQKRLHMPVVTVAALQNDGLDKLKTAVREWFDALAPIDAPTAILTNRRHIDAMQCAAQALHDGIESLDRYDLDCSTIDLRRAWSALGEISGVTVDETIIDRIFSKFCLGK